MSVTISWDGLFSILMTVIRISLGQRIDLNQDMNENTISLIKDYHGILI
jgi:hypothetical protein